MLPVPYLSILLLNTLPETQELHLALTCDSTFTPLFNIISGGAECVTWHLHLKINSEANVIFRISRQELICRAF